MSKYFQDVKACIQTNYEFSLGKLFSSKRLSVGGDFAKWNEFFLEKKFFHSAYQKHVALFVMRASLCFSKNQNGKRIWYPKAGNRSLVLFYDKLFHEYFIIVFGYFKNGKPSKIFWKIIEKRRIVFLYRKNGNSKFWKIPYLSNNRDFQRRMKKHFFCFSKEGRLIARVWKNLKNGLKRDSTQVPVGYLTEVLLHICLKPSLCKRFDHEVKSCQF